MLIRAGLSCLVLQAVFMFLGPHVRSADLLVGRACLSGTAETLIGGDPWVPMSLSWARTPPQQAPLRAPGARPEGRRRKLGRKVTIAGCVNRAPAHGAAADDRSGGKLYRADLPPLAVRAPSDARGRRRPECGRAPVRGAAATDRSGDELHRVVWVTSVVAIRWLWRKVRGSRSQPWQACIAGNTRFRHFQQCKLDTPFCTTQACIRAYAGCQTRVDCIA
jgi:hypothetical protein